MSNLEKSFPTSPFRGMADYTNAEHNAAASSNGAYQYYTHEISASPSIRKSLRNSLRRSSSKSSSSKTYTPPQIPYSQSMPDEHHHHDRPPIERTASGGLFVLNPNSPSHPKMGRSASTGGIFARKANKNTKKEDLVRARAEELGMRFERSTERALDGGGERDYLLNKAAVHVLPTKSSKQLRKEALERYNAKKNNEVVGTQDPTVNENAKKKSPQKKKEKTAIAFAQPRRSPLSLGKKNNGTTSPTSVIGKKKAEPLLASKPYQDPFFNLEETYEQEQRKSSRCLLYETAEAMHNKVTVPTNGGEIAALGRHNVDGCVTTSTAATNGYGCRDGAAARDSERMQGLPTLC